MSGNVECVWPLGATIGEGPVWDARHNILWFVDIRRGSLHRWNPSDARGTSFMVGGLPSFVLPSTDDALLIGNGDALLQWRGGEERVLARIATRPRERLNDATVDPLGRVWFGSMDDGEIERSGVVRLFADGRVHEVGGNAIITNGPAISIDGRWLYHVDTLERTIWRFDVSRSDILTNAHPFIRIDEDDGTPDGITVDSEDHLWVGLWGGWAARRYSPEGNMVEEVRFPCANVTKIAFGGPDYRTAFVTTARAGLDNDALKTQPLAGGLFTFTASVPGRPLPLAKTT